MGRDIRVADISTKSMSMIARVAKKDKRAA